MEWIDDKLAEHRKAKSDLREIEGAADGIFDEIWAEVVDIANYAQQKGMRTSTGGSYDERVVSMSVYPTGNQTSASPRTLNLKLTTDRRKIVVRSDGKNQEFSIEVCDDGVVCLKMDGHRIAPKQAARFVMEAFLFEGKSPFTSIL